MENSIASEVFPSGQLHDAWIPDNQPFDYLVAQEISAVINYHELRF